MKDTLSNLIAGVQIAFAQPFRLEDAVVVEEEYGWIEEIGTMYVVLRIGSPQHRRPRRRRYFGGDLSKIP